MNFSVLLSLYKKEQPIFLMESLDSVFNQTCPPPEVVLVLDGKITDELHTVVSEFKIRHPQILKIIPLEKNVGLGAALDEGLKHCSHELVARMDTDDICFPNRFEKQLAIFEQNPALAVVGSWIDEFADTPENVISTRKLPEKNIELIKYAKSRSPLNHPSVMFRKSIVQKAGGYQHFYLLEDYFLWVRLIAEKQELYNIQESLLSFRVSPNMIARRGGWKYAKSEIRLFKTFRKMEFISYPAFLKNVAIRVISRLIPNKCRIFLYRNFLRQ